ncbi:hypothetical protein BKA70DRAFT_1489925 [Coprinopsis sp. MPI-PUGE-AT-0042]|nr:hypothetical protein BKA70DRAFT_1489925 [Coprinopsis sp. MPI-PUGE-AT-0042]
MAQQNGNGCPSNGMVWYRDPYTTPTSPGKAIDNILGGPGAGEGAFKPRRANLYRDSRLAIAHQLSVARTSRLGQKRVFTQGGTIKVEIELTADIPLPFALLRDPQSPALGGVVHHNENWLAPGRVEDEIDCGEGRMRRHVALIITGMPKREVGAQRWRWWWLKGRKPSLKYSHFQAQNKIEFKGLVAPGTKFVIAQCKSQAMTNIVTDFPREAEGIGHKECAHLDLNKRGEDCINTTLTC